MMVATNIPGIAHGFQDSVRLTANGVAYAFNDKMVVHADGADIFGVSDQFQYVYRPVSGDFDVAVRVESLLNTDNDAKAGIMARVPRRGAFARQILIKSGRGDITNVVWQNDTYYLIEAGTNTVSVFQPTAGDPHLDIRNKTNMTIEGLGWSSVIQSYQTGTVFRVWDCKDITFRNFANIGTRGPDAGHNYNVSGFNGQFAAFEERGTNENIRYERLLVKNHSNHGIAGLSIARCSANSIIIDNTWEFIGSTNATFGDLIFDGAAVVVPGYGARIANNRFFGNFRDIEFEGDVSSASGSLGYKNIIVEGNTMEETRGESISFLAGAGANEGTADIQVINNAITYDRVNRLADYSLCLVALQGRRITVRDNKFMNGRYGMLIYTPTGYTMSDWLIEDNHFVGNERGIGIVRPESRNIMIEATPGRFVLQYRTNAVGANSVAVSSPRPPTAFPLCWVRLARSGSIFTAYSSTNYGVWTLMGSYDTSVDVDGAYPTDILLGLAVTSHDPNEITQAIFSDFNPVPPSLLIERNRNLLELSWPTTAIGFDLQATPSLSPAVRWTNVPGSSLTNRMQISPRDNALFFRLNN